MYKCLKTILVLAAMGALAWSPVQANAASPGYDQVRQIEEAYQNGQYDRFLRDLNSSYRREKSSRWVREMMEMTQQPQQGPQGPQGPRGDRGQAQEMPKEFQEQEKQMEALGQEFNEALRNICSGSDDPVCQRVESLLQQRDDRGQQQGPGLSEQLLFSPPSRSDGIFNDLREIEQEYYIKSMLIGGGPQQQGRGGPQQQQQQQQQIDPQLMIVLAMDKLNKMRQVVQRAPEHDLHSRVMELQDAAMGAWVQMLDSMYISGLGSGQNRPQSQTEEEIARAMKDFQEKMGRMMQSFQPQDQDQGPPQGYDRGRGRDMDRGDRRGYRDSRYREGDRGYGPQYQEEPQEDRGRYGPPGYY